MPLLPPVPSRRDALRAAGAALAAAAFPRPALAQAADPRAVVQGFNDALLDVMKRGIQLGFQGRFGALKPAFERTFDVPFMTRVIVGSGWTATPPEQQARLMAAFTRFSVASYARSFRVFDGERFVVNGTKEYPQGTMVLSDIVPAGGKAVALNYLLHKDAEGRWRIFDVFLDGTISQLATRRSDFATTLRAEGADGLIRQLQAKADELAVGP